MMMLRTGTSLKRAEDRGPRTEDRGPKTEDRRRKNRFFCFFGFRSSDFGLRLGFTLVEIMVAVSVLTAGILLIYPSFFITADAAGYATDQLTTQVWAQEKMWEEKDAILKLRGASKLEEGGSFEANNRVFAWEKTITCAGESLYNLNLILTWKQSGREREAEYSTIVSVGVAEEIV